MVTPIPRSTARRAIRRAADFFGSGILIPFLWTGIRDTSGQELRAGDNGLYQSRGPITILDHFGSHCFQEWFVRQQKRSAKGIYKQLAVQIVKKISFTIR